MIFDVNIRNVALDNVNVYIFLPLARHFGKNVTHRGSTRFGVSAESSIGRPVQSPSP